MSRETRAKRGDLYVGGDTGFPFRRVVLESPLAGHGTEHAGKYTTNVRYARACLRDALGRGEAPIAFHLLYPQVLDDKLEPERAYGIGAGQAWIAQAQALVVYRDRGISNGMKRSINIAEAIGKPIEYRELGEWE
jgi:hypothetical protein